MLDRLIDLLVSCWNAIRPVLVVDDDERAVLLWLGRFSRVLEPGMHWVCPLAHTGRKCKVVQGTMRLHEQSLTTADGKDLTASPIVTARIAEPRKYLLDMDGSSAIDDVTYGAVAEWVHKNTLAHVLDPANWRELTTKVRQAADDYGVQIVRVRFGDLVRSRQIRLLGNVNGS